jgi:opacity protein-like surface antigen
MEAKRQRRLARVALTIATAVAAVFMVVVVPAAPAQAATWHNIAGDVYSNTDWFVSPNFRTKSGTGPISAEFSNLIGGSALKFCVHNSTCSDFNTLRNEQEIRSSMANGTRFQNSFRRVTTCNNCDHHFEGREKY